MNIRSIPSLFSSSPLRSVRGITACLSLMAMSGCDEYNSDVIGTAFNPTNSLVSQFVHPVYVEYREGGVRIWGPNAGLVTAQAEGARLSLTSEDDSLALVVYGNAVGDSLNPLNGQLRIDMDRDFALYLNGLQLHSALGPAIEVQSDGHICYLVLPAKSKNVLSDSIYETQYQNGSILEADGCLYVSGELYCDGIGSLELNNRALPRFDADRGDSVYTSALYARSGLYCNYALTASLTSLYGPAIHTGGAEVALHKGTWKLYPGRDTILTEEASITIGSEAKVYVNDSLWTLPVDSL